MLDLAYFHHEPLKTCCHQCSAICGWIELIFGIKMELIYYSFPMQVIGQSDQDQSQPGIS